MGVLAATVGILFVLSSTSEAAQAERYILVKHRFLADLTLISTGTFPCNQTYFQRDIQVPNQR